MLPMSVLFVWRENHSMSSKPSTVMHANMLSVRCATLVFTNIQSIWVKTGACLTNKYHVPSHNALPNSTFTPFDRSYCWQAKIIKCSNSTMTIWFIVVWSKWLSLFGVHTNVAPDNCTMWKDLQIQQWPASNASSEHASNIAPCGMRTCPAMNMISKPVNYLERMPQTIGWSFTVKSVLTVGGTLRKMKDAIIWPVGSASMNFVGNV